MTETPTSPFDENGYLAPAGPHYDTLCHVRITLVEGIIPYRTRAQLFRSMVQTIYHFIDLPGTDCIKVWIGGHFVSNIPEPTDTDICILVAPEILDHLDKYSRKVVAAFIHPDLDRHHLAKRIYDRWHCSVHILLDEEDTRNPSYPLYQQAKDMMEKLYTRDEAGRPMGYYVCSADRKKSNDQ